jgi:hypothetical protein
MDHARTLSDRLLLSDPGCRDIAPWAQVPTQIGQFLWHTRIEALPQLINVLRDEMSIIDREACSPSFLD